MCPIPFSRLADSGRACLVPSTRALVWSALPLVAACSNTEFGASTATPPHAVPTLAAPRAAARAGEAKPDTGAGTGAATVGGAADLPGTAPGANPVPGDPPAATGTATGGEGNVTDPVVVVPPRPTTPLGVRDACRGARARKSFSLEFASTKRTVGSLCAWSSPPIVGGQKQSEIIRGFHRQTSSVEVPLDALVCASSLRTKESTLWEYDDEVVLTLNDVVVSTSQDGLLFADPEGAREPRLQAANGGYLWDWQRIAAAMLPNIGSTEDSVYCLGALSSSGCRLPLTQAPGSVNLALGTDTVSALSLKALQEKKIEYALVVLGDNDPDRDCKHSGITIEGDLDYVIVQR